MAAKCKMSMNCSKNSINIFQKKKKKIKINIRNSIFSGTEHLFPGTQAFASPPDMASSGVWENIILCKTPTFDGVCGMLY